LNGRLVDPGEGLTGVDSEKGRGAAVRPSNNRKLAKDLKKLALECPDAKARYVFFGAPRFRHERQHKLETVDGIEVWAIDV
jgi:hypothetical protein